jgi:hypothetical protein
VPSDVAAQNKGEINRAHVAMGASSLRTAPLDQATAADANRGLAAERRTMLATVRSGATAPFRDILKGRPLSTCEHPMTPEELRLTSVQFVKGEYPLRINAILRVE